jgi:hypothetical protein
MSKTLIQVEDTIDTSFTKDQINLLIESLLFSCSVNICADWKEEELRKMLKLAENLKKSINKDINLENISFVEEENYEDAWTSDMHNVFKDFYGIVSIKDI